MLMSITWARGTFEEMRNCGFQTFKGTRRQKLPHQAVASAFQILLDVPFLINKRVSPKVQVVRTLGPKELRFRREGRFVLLVNGARHVLPVMKGVLSTR